MLKLLVALGLGFLAPAALTKLTPPHPVALAETVNHSITDEAEKTRSVVVLNGATETEALVMDVLQARGIEHPEALATIMGNIKQESRFTPNICEGGARVNYDRCHSGGFGLIQWTTKGRYNGLGRHARNLGLDPSKIEAQLSYVFQEREWRKVEHRFRTPGKSISWYMRFAHNWLGWGVHGARTTYAQDYLKRMDVVQVPVSEHPTAKFTPGHHYLK